MNKPDELTPVERHEGIWVKRDDLFTPFGKDTVNGGKLRQCWYLVEKIKDSYKGVVSCCSIYSPQAPITAAVGEHFGLPVEIYYGGTKEENLRRLRMPFIAMRYGAKCSVISKSGIHKILYAKAKKLAKEKGYFVVDYGFNIAEYPDIMVEKVAAQVKNIPAVENLVITCGSGITATSVLLGIEKYGKEVREIYLIATAPDRTEFIRRNLQQYGVKRQFRTIDLFHSNGFVYEKGVQCNIDGIKLHPNYEAKTYAWIKNHPLKGETLLWIVGAKPMR